jgi:putative intracellular protease/amidase
MTSHADMKGRSVTGCSDSEDDELDPSRHLLSSLESALIAKGAKYTRSATNRELHVLEDGALITGQNPASAAFVVLPVTSSKPMETFR